MKYNIDIISRNFFKMMRSGAMNEYVEIEPMSRFKWKILADIFIRHHVVNVASKAVKNHQFEKDFNMPEDIRRYIHDEAEKIKGQNILLKMKNKHLNNKLQKIHATEKKSSDYSRESLELFDILIANCNAILTTGTSMLLIIKLGNYIRINNSKINFQKVNKWLGEIQMRRVAVLVGSILITNFAFKVEEVPFVTKPDSKAAKVMLESLLNKVEDKHNSGITYFEYAPLENASILMGRLKGRLDSIEE